MNRRWRRPNDRRHPRPPVGQASSSTGTTAAQKSSVRPVDPFTTPTLGELEYVEPPPLWEEGRQGILNSTGARVPERTFRRPVPIVARIVWEQDGEEHIETEALGWPGQNVYVRLPDPRYRFTAVWLDAVDIRRRG